MADVAAVREIEERALKAWSALRTVLVGGWEVRFAAGCTKRANSANALEPSIPFDDVRREVEALYAAAGQPAIFRITPLAPPFADDALAGAGYRLIDPSIVMAADLPAFSASSAVTIADTPTPAWLDGIAAANNIAPPLRPVHDRIVQAIATPAAFATLSVDGKPAGYGLAVCDRGRVGLFDVVVAATHRGRGFSRPLTETLLAWGRAHGAAAAYLQVGAGNGAALGLYHRLGFREAYRYHYRIRHFAI
ncbi:MAG: GNAT family N-acetyltransferase [Hyphomicrobiales bacterium]